MENTLNTFFTWMMSSAEKKGKFSQAEEQEDALFFSKNVHEYFSFWGKPRKNKNTCGWCSSVFLWYQGISNCWLRRVDSFPTCLFFLLKMKKSSCQFSIFFFFRCGAPSGYEKHGAWSCGPLDPPPAPYPKASDDYTYLKFVLGTRKKDFSSSD